MLASPSLADRCVGVGRLHNVPRRQRLAVAGYLNDFHSPREAQDVAVSDVGIARVPMADVEPHMGIVLT
jgi:hypothetical protein